MTVSRPLAALASPALAPTATDIFLGDAGIEYLRGFEKLPNLRTLHLPNNLVSSLDGLAGCFRLKYLFARNNRIRSLVGLFDACPHIVELDLAANAISFLDTCVAELSGTRLTHLNLRGNPVSQESGYRARVIAAVPSLEVLDDLVVSPEERRDAERAVYGTVNGSRGPESAKPASRTASSTARPSTAAAASGLGSNGSILARELEREVRAIKDKRRERTRQELEQSMRRVVDPAWEAAVAATQHLRAPSTASGTARPAGPGSVIDGAETRSFADRTGSLLAPAVVVPSALMTAIANEASAGGEELVQRGIRAGMLRREVALPDTIPEVAVRPESSAAAPPSKQEAALLKTALVASFLPRPHSSAAPLHGSGAATAVPPKGLTLGSRAGTAMTGGVANGNAASLVTTASITPAAPPASSAVVSAVLAASLKASALTAYSRAPPPASGAFGGIRPQTAALAASGIPSLGGSASAMSLPGLHGTLGLTRPGTSSAFGASTAASAVGQAASPLRSSGHLSLRERKRGDPAQFQRTVAAKVQRLLAVERSGGLTADATAAAPASPASAGAGTRTLGGVATGTGVSDGNGAAAQLVGWDRFRVVQAIEQFARNLDAAATSADAQAVATVSAAGGAAGVAGAGSKPPSATVRAASGAPAASARTAASAGLAGAAVGATSSAAASGGATSAGATARRSGAAGPVRTHLLPAQLRAALQSCMDYGLVPEPEPAPGSDSGVASRVTSRRPSGSADSTATAASGGGGGGSAASAAARDELSRYVEETAAAMGFARGTPVPWQAFLAACETGSYTRSSSGAAAAAAAAASAGVGATAASDASSSASASSSLSASSGPGIVRVRRLRWRPLSLSEAEEQAAGHFKRAADALAALRRIPESDPSAEGLRRVVASGTERGNRLLDIAAALRGSYDPPAQPPPPRRPRSDIYAYASLLPATLAGKLKEKALVSGGTLGWSHEVPAPGEESDEDEDDAVQLLLRAERHTPAVGSGGAAPAFRQSSAAARTAGGMAATGSLPASTGDRGDDHASVTSVDGALVGRLKDAMASDVWSRYRRKARLREQHEIVHTALPMP